MDLQKESKIIALTSKLTFLLIEHLRRSLNKKNRDYSGLKDLIYTHKHLHA